MSPETAITTVKWLFGGLAVIAAFLLAQDSVTLEPIVKVVLGAFLALAAYVNPATVASRVIARDDTKTGSTA